MISQLVAQVGMNIKRSSGELKWCLFSKDWDLEQIRNPWSSSHAKILPHFHLGWESGVALGDRAQFEGHRVLQCSEEKMLWMHLFGFGFSSFRKAFGTSTCVGYFCYLIAKSCLTLATPWAVAPLVPLSMGFPRQEYWSGLLFPSPGIFLTQGSNLNRLHWQANSLPLSH